MKIMKEKSNTIKYKVSCIDEMRIVDKKSGYSINIYTTVFHRKVNDRMMECIDFAITLTNEKGELVKKHPSRDINKIYKYLHSTIAEKNNSHHREYVIKVLVVIKEIMKKQKIKLILTNEKMRDKIEEMIDDVTIEILSSNMEV